MALAPFQGINYTSSHGSQSIGLTPLYQGFACVSANTSLMKGKKGCLNKLSKTSIFDESFSKFHDQTRLVGVACSESATTSSASELCSQNSKDSFTSGIRTASVTIHGVGDHIDKKSLEMQLKEVNGIVDVWLGHYFDGGPRGRAAKVQFEMDRGYSLRGIVKDMEALNNQFLVLPFMSHQWTWRGNKINYAVAGCGKPIILVHGFGGNAGHFGNLISYLADKYKVYAIDLLGFGDSEKPPDANYGPVLWAELVTDFAKEFTKEGAVLIGNSIGSLTALTAAAQGGNELFRGIVLLNCAGAMNRKGLTEEGLLLRALTPVFFAIECLLQNPSVAGYLFNRFRNKENIKKILEEQAYRNKEAVTEQLVDILYHPSGDSGALNVFVKVFTGDPGPRPEKLMSDIDAPVLVLWGDSDPWTPVTGPVAKYFIDLSTKRENVQVYSLPDVGHCPHDDRPELAVQYIVPFVDSLGW